MHYVHIESSCTEKITLQKVKSEQIMLVMPHSLCYTGGIMLLPCLSHLLSVSCQINFFRFTRILNRFQWSFVEGNRYHEQIKWLLFGRNRNKGAGYERKLESTSVGFAAVSNTCWRLVNARVSHRCKTEFTSLTAQTMADASADIISRKFCINILRTLSTCFFFY